MIAHETDRNEEQRVVACFGDFRQHLLHVGAEPRLSGRTGTLIGESPITHTSAPCDLCGAGAELVGVWVGRRENALGQTVRGEDDLHLRRPGKALQRLHDPVRDSVEELWLLPPGAHQGDVESSVRGLQQLLLVRPDRHVRVVGRHRDTDDAILPRAGDFCDRVLDVGMPVPHSHVDAVPVAQRARDAGGLGARQLENR